MCSDVSHGPWQDAAMGDMYLGLFTSKEAVAELWVTQRVSHIMQ